MRIIAGEFRSRPIEAPKGMKTRPTLDKVREAVFSIIMNNVPESSFLDLYAGSGANGLEALSRGAKRVVFVEKDRHAQKIIQANIVSLSLQEKTSLLKMSVQRALDVLKGQSFDLVYMDPPYAKQENEQVIQLLIEKDLLNLDGVIVVEADRNDAYAETIGKMKLWKKKEYGVSQLLFYRKEK
ncbi:MULTISPECIES: 16S rRNA (guanine(966)-N(2))-methyltransferase RsmD [Terrabacteria group]|uniref:16S rRNA (guanine(966)-N(2))-methyltransferase RsmD n=1 Tax=Bacillati TaxID=1783272 RepID=UPI001C6E9F17|nr:MULTISPECIES: 16S rRNA (guanine(966)-N(2))-methyltransferase RsmD [Terrabacteria group]MBW9211982.1 16S rRNA (guanine(966)-N(2))-methyltransferase RsmD [Trueperella sp. zg.1013]